MQVARILSTCLAIVALAVIAALLFLGSILFGIGYSLYAITKSHGKYRWIASTAFILSAAEITGLVTLTFLIGRIGCCC